MSFVSLSQQKKASGDNILRAKQFQTAMSGNVPMLIWLGKNRLGQADKTEITGADDGPVRIVVEYANGKRPTPDAT